MFNSVQNFVTTSLTQRIYSKAAGELLASRPRILLNRPSDAAASEDIRGVDPSVRFDPRIRRIQHHEQRVRATGRRWLTRSFYALSLLSYVLALSHFVLEALVFRTAGLGAGLISPLIVASRFPPLSDHADIVHSHLSRMDDEPHALPTLWSIR